MFTGLVEHIGVISNRHNQRLTITTNTALDNPVIGESIAVNGCCLTLEKAIGNNLIFFVMSETLSRTNLGMLPIGAGVHLERAMKLGDRMGGHIVQGHVDAACKVLSAQTVDNGDFELEIENKDILRHEIVLKGSVAVDGVSLTVCGITEHSFAVHLIPETLKRTCLVSRSGKHVNIETDIIAKYVRRILSAHSDDNHTITWDKLAKAGFL